MIILGECQKSMKKAHLNVLHLTTSFPESDDDFSGLFVLRLIEALEKRSIHCKVLAPAGNGRQSCVVSNSVHRFRYAPLSWQCLANQRGGIPESLRRNPLISLLVPPFLTSMACNVIAHAKECDLIHAHWSVCGALAVLTQKIHKKPVITTLRGTDMRWGSVPGPYQWLHKICVRNSVVTVGVSEEIVWKLRKSFPRYKNRFVFIPNGVSADFFSVARPSSLYSSSLRLLYVGNLVPSKGVDVLIRAMALIDKNESLELTIAGDGPQKKELKNLIFKCGLMEKVKIIGPVASKDVPDLMSTHNTLILPSYSEGRPNVVLEAMAAGIPVIGTDIKSIRELVQDGTTGWIIPLGDVNALASIISDLFKGIKDWRTAGQAGHNWVMENGLTWERSCTRYCDLYFQHSRQVTNTAPDRNEYHQ